MMVLSSFDMSQTLCTLFALQLFLVWKKNQQKQMKKWLLKHTAICAINFQYSFVSFFCSRHFRIVNKNAVTNESQDVHISLRRHKTYILPFSFHWLASETSSLLISIIDVQARAAAVAAATATKIAHD